jgi:hypothetical protein
MIFSNKLVFAYDSIWHYPHEYLPRQQEWRVKKKDNKTTRQISTIAGIKVSKTVHAKNP